MATTTFVQCGQFSDAEDDEICSHHNQYLNLQVKKMLTEKEYISFLGIRLTWNQPIKKFILCDGRDMVRSEGNIVNGSDGSNSIFT